MEGFADKGEVCDLNGSAIELDRWTGTSTGGLYGACSGEEGGESTRFAADALGVGKRATEFGEAARVSADEATPRPPAPPPGEGEAALRPWCDDWWCALLLMGVPPMVDELSTSPSYLKGPSA